MNLVLTKTLLVMLGISSFSNAFPLAQEEVTAQPLLLTQEEVTAQPQSWGWDYLNQQRHKIRLALSPPLDNTNPPTRPYEQEKLSPKPSRPIFKTPPSNRKTTGAPLKPVEPSHAPQSPTQEKMDQNVPENTNKSQSSNMSAVEMGNEVPMNSAAKPSASISVYLLAILVCYYWYWCYVLFFKVFIFVKEIVSHLLYTVGLKLFVPHNMNQLELLKVTKTFSGAISTEFGVDK